VTPVLQLYSSLSVCVVLFHSYINNNLNLTAKEITLKNSQHLRNDHFISNGTAKDLAITWYSCTIPANIF